MEEIAESAAEDEFDASLCQIRLISQGDCEKDTLVMHIHGGGYLAFSSFIH